MLHLLKDYKYGATRWSTPYLEVYFPVLALNNVSKFEVAKKRDMWTLNNVSILHNIYKWFTVILLLLSVI